MGNDIFADYSNNLYYRDCQIVYMKEVLKFTYKEISSYVKLAVSTIKTYYFKYRKELLEKAKRIFGKKQPSKVYFDCIITKKPCAYIIEIYKKENKIEYLKVGKTNNLYRRMNELLKEYKAYAIVVKKIYEVENEDDALIMESTLRKFYKSKENCGFVRQDRFCNVIFNNEELEQNEKIKKQYEFLV